MEIRCEYKKTAEGNVYIKIPSRAVNYHVIQEILKLSEKNDNCMLRVDIKNISPLRTITQNKLLHGLIREIVIRECGAYDEKVAPEDVESVKLGLKERAAVNNKYPMIEYIDEEGNLQKRPKSTKELSTSEMGVFIDFIRFVLYPDLRQFSPLDD